MRAMHGGELDRACWAFLVGLVGTWLARNRNLNRNKSGSFQLLAREIDGKGGDEFLPLQPSVTSGCIPATLKHKHAHHTTHD